MDMNEHGRKSGVFAWVPDLLRALGLKSDLRREPEHPPVRDEPGPSGLPPAPPRVEKRGL